MTYNLTAILFTDLPSKNIQLKLCWVPSLQGITVNEIVDLHAKNDIPNGIADGGTITTQCIYWRTRKRSLGKIEKLSSTVLIIQKTQQTHYGLKKKKTDSEIV